LSDDAVAVLTSLPQVCPYVLPNLKTMKPHGSIFNAWHTARKRAGLADVRIHDLRHTLASQLAGAGHSLWVIANVLGHSQTRTTERYAHLSGETLRNAVNSAARVSGTTWASTTE
jgi:integrase